MKNEENICQYGAKQRAITTIVKRLLKSNVTKVVLLTNRNELA